MSIQVDIHLPTKKEKQYKLGYHRCVRLHEAGHAVVAELMVPGSVVLVRTRNERSIRLSDAETAVVGGKYCDGHVAYQTNMMGLSFLDFVAARITITMAGVAFQNLEKFKELGLEKIIEDENKLIASLIRAARADAGAVDDSRLFRFGRSTVAQLRANPKVRACVICVADLLEHEDVSGETLRQIVVPFHLPRFIYDEVEAREEENVFLDTVASS